MRRQREGSILDVCPEPRQTLYEQRSVLFLPLAQKFFTGHALLTPQQRHNLDCFSPAHFDLLEIGLSLCASEDSFVRAPPWHRTLLSSDLVWNLVSLLITLSLIHISEPTRLGMISYAVFC